LPSNRFGQSKNALEFLFNPKIHLYSRQDTSKANSFDVSIVMTIPLFRVSVTIGLSLLPLTVWFSQYFS